MEYTVENITKFIGETQDGKKLKENDVFSKFLLDLIERNTNPSTENVNLEELLNDLYYSISEFTKARNAVKVLYLQ